MGGRRRAAAVDIVVVVPRAKVALLGALWVVEGAAFFLLQSMNFSQFGKCKRQTASSVAAAAAAAAAAETAADY